MRGTGALSGPPGRRRGKNLLSLSVVFQAVVFPCLIFSQKSWRKVWIGRKNWLIFAPAFGPGTVPGHGGKDEGERGSLTRMRRGKTSSDGRPACFFAGRQEALARTMKITKETHTMQSLILAQDER